MVHEVPPIEDVPHVDDVDPRTLVSLAYVRDDDTLYRVLPNHERDGQFDLVEVEDAADRVAWDASASSGGAGSGEASGPGDGSGSDDVP